MYECTFTEIYFIEKYDMENEFIFFLVMTTDEHYVVCLGNDSNTKKEYVRVHHLKKGTFLHKISLKYPNFKEIKVIVLTIIVCSISFSHILF